MILVIDHVAAVRTEVAFDVETKLFFYIGPQIHRDQMERFLMHRAALDRVDGPLWPTRIGFQTALEQVDNGGLTTTNWTHQQQNTLTYFEALCRRMEVVNDLLERLLDAENFLTEKFIAWFASAGRLDTSIHNHLINALVGELRYFR